MKNLRKLAIIVLGVILSLSVFTMISCSKEETPEQMVVKVAQYIAEDNDEDLSDVKFVSGKVKESEDEENVYTIYARIKVRGYTMYFLAYYNSESGDISYIDNTILASYITSSSAYNDTESLDIKSINEALGNM